MSKIYVIGLSFILFLGCKGNDERTTDKEQTKTVDLDSEKKAISAVITNFNKYYSSKNMDGFKKLFANEVHFFGTDSAEVINSMAEFENQAKNDWALFEEVNVGEPRNVFIETDSAAQLGAAVYECSWDIKMQGKWHHSLARFSDVLRKEAGEWKIAGGMVAIATVGESSAELARKMKK